MSNAAIRITDQIGSEVHLPGNPNRIISLVPSQTELLFHLGLAHKIVGVTKFCCHPIDQIRNVRKIGGTKKFNFDVIDELKPDLIIGNKEENYKEGIDRLREKYPVWTSDVFNLEDAIDMIQKIGLLTNEADKTSVLVEGITTGFNKLKISKQRTALYVIWQNPVMVAAGNTFINDIMGRCGLVNVARSFSRYPELSKEQIVELNPDVILLSTEPFPFKQNHTIQWTQNFEKPTILVDGEYFSWYGSRLIEAPKYFEKLMLDEI